MNKLVDEEKCDNIFNLIMSSTDDSSTALEMSDELPKKSSTYRKENVLEFISRVCQ